MRGFLESIILACIRAKSAGVAIIFCVCSCAIAKAQTYSEGWYQIKRTVNIAEIANIDFSKISSLTGLSSLISNVSYLTTGDEITTNVTIPVINISAGTAVYGARLLDVNGTSDYTADLSGKSGRNANEQELSTYYYITPVGADDDGEWRYTIRSVNGHYIGTNGRYYAEAKEVYINSSLGFSLGTSTDAIMSSLTSTLGVCIGSKQYTVSSSFINNIPYIDRLDIYTQMKPLIEVLGNANVKMSEYTWAKKSITGTNSSANGDSIQCIASTSMLDVLSGLAQNSEQIISYYNNNDYESLARVLMQYVGLDLFKLKKIDLSNVATTSGLFAKHIKLTPYTVNIISFGDNFSLDAIDYRTADALTHLSQKTNQNAMVTFSGKVASDKVLTKVYNGGTLFLTSGSAMGDASQLISFVEDNGTDVVDLSRAQHAVFTDDNLHTVDVIASSPNKTTLLGISQWSSNYKTVGINAAGYATLYSPFELIIPEDEKSIFGTIKKNAPKVYVAYKQEDDEIHCTPYEVHVPANTPVIICGDAKQSYNFTVVEAENASDTYTGDNLLTGTYADYAVPTGINAYRLATAADGKTPVFTQVGDEDSTISAWSAYLSANSNGVDTYKLIFDNQSSGISNVYIDADNAGSVDANGNVIGNAVIYDITGRRVHASTLSPGLYIVNGVKTVIR